MLFASWLPRAGETVFILAIVLLVLSDDALSQEKRFEARKHWWDLAQNELAAALNVRQNMNGAKNILLFLGDGMGITASTAGRIYKGQKNGMHGEEGYLAWERFPNMGLLKTYNVDRQVPDSAGTATAYLCGTKSNYYTLAVDPEVKLGDCAASKNPLYRVPSVLQWAQEAGKHTGKVTTTRVTHATPAAAYAHSAHRNWECDGNLGDRGQGCKDIADQLITENPGRDIRVIMGGGRQMFGAQLDHPNSKGNLCRRKDGRNLAREWATDKIARGYNAAYVTDSHELARVNPDTTDFLMGLFNDTHMPFEVDRQENFMPVPSLKEMTLVALRFLKKSQKGFFLLVEGGRIDHALHDNLPKKALEDTVALDAAVQAALLELDLENTLVLVTADHSHVMTFNGYPERGNDILGIGDISKIDQLPYTTLMFTNGPGWKYTAEGNIVSRIDPRHEDLRSSNYQSLAAVPRGRIDETHGGEDVAVFAVGPMSHLFHRVHEQHYVAHVMAYAACIGPSKGVKCQRPASSAIGTIDVAGAIAAAGTTAAFSAATAQVCTLPQCSNPPQFVGVSPKFPTISPILQQLINSNENKTFRLLSLFLNGKRIKASGNSKIGVHQQHII
ncbi:unnamed protein product, partial [Meganyctiphanes norvegica]